MKDTDNLEGGRHIRGDGEQSGQEEEHPQDLHHIPYIDDDVESVNTKNKDIASEDEQRVRNSSNKGLKVVFNETKVRTQDLKAERKEDRVMHSLGAIRKNNLGSRSTNQREIITTKDSKMKKRSVLRTLGDMFSNLTLSKNENKSRCENKGNASFHRSTEKGSSVCDKIDSQTIQIRKYAPHERKLNRSISDLGQVKISAMKFKKQTQKSGVPKKDMMRDWSKIYEEMCERAQKLDSAIEQATKDEMQVRPVNRFSTTDPPDHTDNKCSRAKRDSEYNGSFFSINSTGTSGQTGSAETLSLYSLDGEREIQGEQEQGKHTEEKTLPRKYSGEKKSFYKTQSLDMEEIEIVNLDQPVQQIQYSGLRKQMTVTESVEL